MQISKDISKHFIEVISSLVSHHTHKVKGTYGYLLLILKFRKALFVTNATSYQAFVVHLNVGTFIVQILYPNAGMDRLTWI